MKFVAAFFLAVMMLVCFAFYGPAAVTQIGGLAVAQSGTQWNNLKDMAAGDGLANGAGMFAPCLFNGTTCDRQRGSVTNGALVDVTRAPGGNQTPADAFANPSTFQGTWSLNGISNGVTWDQQRIGQTTGVNTAMTTGLAASSIYGYDFTGATQNRYKAITQIGGQQTAITNVTGSFSSITTNGDTFVALGANVAYVLQKLVISTPGVTSNIIVRTEPDGSAPCGGAGSAIITTVSTTAQNSLDLGSLYLANPLCFTTAGGTAATLLVTYAGDTE